MMTAVIAADRGRLKSMLRVNLMTAKKRWEVITRFRSAVPVAPSAKLELVLTIPPDYGARLNYYYFGDPDRVLGVICAQHIIGKKMIWEPKRAKITKISDMRGRKVIKLKEKVLEAHRLRT